MKWYSGVAARDPCTGHNKLVFAHVMTACSVCPVKLCGAVSRRQVGDVVVDLLSRNTVDF